MSLIFTETFRSVPSSTSFPGKWTGVTFIRQTSSGRSTGNGSGYGNGASGYLERILDPTEEHATITMGMAALRPSGATTNGSLFHLMSDTATTTHISVRRNTSGYVEVYRGNIVTLLGTSSSQVLMTDGVYEYLEIKVVLHDSAGSVDVLRDGASILSLSGIDTKNAGTKTVFDTVRFYSGWNSALISDLYMTNGAGSVNTGLLYAPKVVALWPDGNGAVSNGVGSDGNSTDNYALVDDASTQAMDASDYVDLANTGDEDSYTFSAIPSGVASAASVYGVMAWSYAQKTDAGARSLTHTARSGGSSTDVAATGALVNGTWQGRGSAFESKPGGGGWVASDLNSMEFGIKAGA
jgi:hypothetical protein